MRKGYKPQRHDILSIHEKHSYWGGVLTSAVGIALVVALAWPLGTKIRDCFQPVAKALTATSPQPQTIRKAFPAIPAVKSAP